MDVFEFSKNADEMNEGELRATLVDLVAKHNEQVGDVDNYDAQIESLEGEVDEYREDAESARAFFSELVGSQKDMDPEILAEKFTATELQDQIDMDAFTQEADADEEEEETTFSDRPGKSDNHPGEEAIAQYRSDARAALTRMGVASFDD